jgi:UTP--glucose-1-phosphate uridylyltransferase
MLPIVDKPLIQYAVEEAVAAGIDTMIFVTGRNKRAIPDHFDKSYELEKELEAKNKLRVLDMVRNILPSHVSCIFIRQLIRCRYQNLNHSLSLPYKCKLIPPV